MSKHDRKNDDGLFQVYYDGLIPWITEGIKILDQRLTKLFEDSNKLSVATENLKMQMRQLQNENDAKSMKIIELEERLQRIEKSHDGR